MAKVPVAEQVQVNFRMPEDLRDRIRVHAAKQGRSMNALIIETLEEKFPKTFVPGFSDEFMIAFIDKAISENRYDEATRAAMLKTKAEVLESMAKSKK